MLLLKRKGFTLIELMVVIAIIAVLAAVVTPQIFRQMAKGRRASAEAFYNSVKTAAHAYFSDTGQWPPNGAAGIAAFSTNPGGAVANSWDGPYIENWPTGTPWSSAVTYTWGWAAAGTNFNAVGAGERWITIPALGIPTVTDRTRIDIDLDGASGAGTGKVRITGAGVLICVSRDGLVS